MSELAEHSTTHISDDMRAVVGREVPEIAQLKAWNTPLQL